MRQQLESDVLEGGRRGGDNKTEEREITMQDEEGMTWKEGDQTGERTEGN